MTPCIGYFSYYCDQVPNKKELKGKGGMSVLTVSGDSAHHIQESMSAGAWGRCSYFIHSQESERKQEVGQGYKPQDQPTLSDILCQVPLPKGSTTFPKSIPNWEPT